MKNIANELNTALQKPRKKRPPRVRPVKLKYLGIDDTKVYSDGRNYTAVVVDVQYQDRKVKEWRQKDFNQDFPDGKIIGDLIQAESEAGLSCLDGETLYEVLCVENDDNYIVWKSIKRVQNDSEAA